MPEHKKTRAFFETSYFKVTRRVDKDLISAVKDLPCLVCNKYGVDVHHVTTVGAGGGDKIDNLMPLCRNHHTELHRIGILTMSDKYIEISIWLNEHKRHDILRKKIKIKV